MIERTDLKHLPEFYGNIYNSAYMDALLALGFAKRDLEESRSLFASKWWDYRFLHLGHSIHLFAHYYIDACDRYRSLFGVDLKKPLHHLSKPIYRTNFQGKSKLIAASSRTAWIRSVMFADSYGIPYDKWIEYAFAYALDNKWQHMPHPINLYTDRLALHIHHRWEEEKANLLHLPTDPRYLAENYVGHKWQNEFQDWLLDTISKRPNPVIALKHFIYKEPFAVESLARERLGDMIVDAAISN